MKYTSLHVGCINVDFITLKVKKVDKRSKVASNGQPKVDEGELSSPLGEPNASLKEENVNSRVVVYMGCNVM